MLTTTMAKPNALPLIMPADGEYTPVPESKSLTLLVENNNSVAWYEGLIMQDGQQVKLNRSNFSRANRHRQCDTGQTAACGQGLWQRGRAGSDDQSGGRRQLRAIWWMRWMK